MQYSEHLHETFIVYAAKTMNLSEFAKIAAMGEYYMYNNGYNALIHIIQIYTQDAYEKIRILLENQPPALYDSSMKSVYSWIISQRKIPIGEKLTFFRLFEGEVSDDELESALFSVDLLGNTLLSHACEYNDLNLFTSIVDYIQELTQMEISEILNFSSAQYQQDTPFRSPEYLQLTQGLREKNAKLPNLKVQENFTPKNLLEVSIEVHSQELIQYLLANGYDKTNHTRSEVRLASQCFPPDSFYLFNTFYDFGIIKDKDFIYFVNIEHLRFDFIVRAIRKSIQKLSSNAKSLKLLTELLFVSKSRTGIVLQVIQADNPQYFVSIM